MFITFEGLDFCGKSTQVLLLEKYLINIGIVVLIVREPGGTEISEKIRDILLDKNNNEMKSETELLLFAASRSQLVNQKILPALDKKQCVISDRFHDSSIAYQSFGRGLNFDFIYKLQSFVIGKAVPDLTFFIDIPVQEVIVRMSKVKRIELDRIESSKTDFYEKVRKGYLSLAKNEKRIKIVNGLLSIEEIHKIVINEYEKIISRKESYVK